MVLTKAQIGQLPKITRQKLLDILLIIEDQLQYECSDVTETIEYLYDCILED